MFSSVTGFCRSAQVHGSAAVPAVPKRIRDKPLKIALVTEGTYPVVTGGVSTWCNQLITGMPDHDFEIFALTGSGADRPVWKLPENVRSLRIIPVWGPPAAPLRPGSRRKEWIDRTQDELALLWDAALGSDDADAVARTDEALRNLVAISNRIGLAHALATRGSVAPILAAWTRHLVRAGEPPMSVADAVMAASIVDRALALVDQRPAGADVIHASSNGPSSLVALAHSWRHGTPILLTEHGVYLRERYLALHGANFSWPVRRAVTAFLRRLCQVVVARAHMVLPVNQFNARWERRLGALPERIHTIPNGVDPETFLPVTSEPELPTISFVGRIDPLKDLETLISAFALVRQQVPTAQLRLFGPTPTENHAYKAGLVELAASLGVTDAVHWEGPSKGSRPAIEAGHVVALSSVSEGLPFTLIESMMCGRATVNTDVGGVAECLDEERTTGMLVPAREPAAFADACITLLSNDRLRADMGAAARRRALAEFTLDRCLGRYREAYAATRDGRLFEHPPAAGFRSGTATGAHGAPTPAVPALRDASQRLSA
ncbi:GT4 family glycosyltransferase PelF [Arthrobacter sp. zg-Y750]|uniref:GT4 family glycosyltransferase PelF n=1 Tax=Arthrobacter sp. zg-Y750 TaxID=2894189 RepID=UPI001E481FA6|nr:GT4 family glycosyltransferase PelF [Arthrobacter sp. zg-Y750]MCC9177892.1 GT4 family glycosyltransferase PelF [Arthrobacter sp. zg-Y750]